METPLRETEVTFFLDMRILSKLKCLAVATTFNATATSVYDVTSNLHRLLHIVPA